jgi:DNA-binding CsgD family transcriptional regulator
MGLVGRRAELAVLREYLHTVRERHCGLVLVAGEPGVGKTRLATEAADLARARGFHVAWAHCRETEGAPAYWPWTQALRAVLRQVPAEDHPEEAADLAPLLELSAAAPSGADRFRLFDAAIRLLERVAELRPLLLVFDDLHRADAPSLRLLRFVAAGAGDAPLLLLGTYRDTEVGYDDPLTRLVGENVSSERCSLLHLSGLNVEETRDLMAQLLGPEAPIDVAELHERTGGNPFFVTEVLRGDPHAGVPATVEAAIRARLRALPQDTTEALGAAAVLGRDIDTGLLARLTDRPRDKVADALAPAMRAGLLVPHPELAGTYRFVHVLVQQVGYTDLGETEREHLHDQAVRVLEAQPETTVAASDLASHAVRAAAVPGGRSRAHAHALRAARRAAARLAYEEAARWYAAALDVARDEQRLDVLLELGDVAGRAGLSTDARSAYEEAWQLAASRGTLPLLGQAALGVGDIVVSAGTVDAGLVRLLEQTLSRIGGQDPYLRVRVLARLAVELYWGPDLARARALARQAVSAARRLGDDHALAAALDAEQFVLRGPGLLEVRVRLGEELVALASRLGDEELELRARRLLVPDRLQQHHLPAADAELESLAAFAGQTRRPLARWYVLMYRATRATIVGRYDDALGLIDEMEALGQRIDAQPTPIYALAQRFVVLRDLGRVHDVENPLRDLCARYPIFATTQAMLALLLAESGRRDEAAVLFESLTADRCESAPPDSLWLATIALLAETAARLGDAGRGETLYELLAPFAGQAIVQGVVSWYGAVDYYLGLAAGASGRVDDAEAHLEAARRFHERWGAVPFLAATLADHSALLRRRDAPGHRQRARTLAAEAQGHARRIGMARLLPASGSGLTAREHEVLEQLADGASNKEIARRLVISVHTVERHVANIYTKLGVRNRAEATAVALRGRSASRPGPSTAGR